MAIDDSLWIVLLARTEGLKDFYQDLIKQQLIDEQDFRAHISKTRREYFEEDFSLDVARDKIIDYLCDNSLQKMYEGDIK